MNEITKIGEAILAVLSAWNPAAAVAENILSVIGALVKAAPAAGIQLPSVFVKDALQAEASYAAIQNGDVAILGTVDYEGKQIALFAIDNASALAKRLFGT